MPFFRIDPVSAQNQIQYLFPGDKAQWIVAESPIIVRFKGIQSTQLANSKTFIQVTGEKSGSITGKTVISSDRRTFIYYPDHPFQAGDKISVTLLPFITPFIDTTITFFTAPKVPETIQKPIQENKILPVKSNPGKKYTPNSDGVVVINGISVPSDFPYIDISVNDNPDTGYIFCNYDRGRYFNLILDNSGAPIFYWVVPDDRRDFQVQETGILTMKVRQGFGGGGYIGLDNTYTVVDTFFAPQGYSIDEHELVVLPNGHYLVTALETRIIDMSKVVAGGKTNARVIGYHLIEMDEKDNPVFIWRCWDHYDITDAEYVDLTQNTIDYLHTNSIAVDLDGNYLITPKILNEITKINRETGEIMWRLGGKKNQFTYIGFDDFVYMQHCVRVLPNGNYTVFDNGNYHVPHYSRALEFKVDTTNMTVTKIWEFRDIPDKQSLYKGNVQRLPNGNTLINWGMQNLPKLTEVRPDGSKAFEMNFAEPIESYRVWRYHWQGRAAVPFLTAETFADKVTLLFNKFGDPDVKEYRVFGGPDQQSESLLKTTASPYAILNENDFTESNTYYFRVTAMDKQGNESGYSNQVQVKTNFIPANVNMILNGNFENGEASWDFTVSGSAFATLTTGNKEGFINIGNGGSDFADIRLSQDNLTLYRGQRYSFEFDARADEIRPIEAKIESTTPPYINYGQIALTVIGPDKKHFEYALTMEDATTNVARVVFNVGQSTGNVSIDNVLFMRLTPTEVLKNPSRSESVEFQLFPVYPNPFNTSVTINYQLSSPVNIELSIYNLLGQKMQILVTGMQRAGRHQVKWEASDFAGGVYFCRLKSEGDHAGKTVYQVRKMVLLK